MYISESSTLPVAPTVFIGTWVIGSAGLWCLGRIFGDIRRVIIYALIFGVFSGIPFLMVLYCGGMLFFLHPCVLVTDTLRIWTSVLGTFVILLSFLNIRRRVLLTKLMAQHFRVSRDRIIVARGISLDQGPADANVGFSRRAARKIIASSATIAVTGIFLQAEMVKVFGNVSVFFLISALTLPYAFYATAQYLGGIYIWIYLVLRLEVTKNMHVVFER
jgi:hypothetical protein